MGGPPGPECTTNIYIYIDRERVTVDVVRRLASLVIINSNCNYDVLYKGIVVKW